MYNNRMYTQCPHRFHSFIHWLHSKHWWIVLRSCNSQLEHNVRLFLLLSDSLISLRIHYKLYIGCISYAIEMTINSIHADPYTYQENLNAVNTLWIWLPHVSVSVSISDILAYRFVRAFGFTVSYIWEVHKHTHSCFYRGSRGCYKNCILTMLSNRSAKHHLEIFPHLYIYLHNTPRTYAVFSMPFERFFCVCFLSGIFVGTNIRRICSVYT